MTDLPDGEICYFTKYIVQPGQKNREGIQMENKYLRAEDLSEYSKDELISKVIDLQNDVLYGKEQIAMLKNQLFGRKTEKTKYIFEDNQLALGDFN